MFSLFLCLGRLDHLIQPKTRSTLTLAILSRRKIMNKCAELESCTREWPVSVALLEADLTMGYFLFLPCGVVGFDHKTFIYWVCTFPFAERLPRRFTFFLIQIASPSVLISCMDECYAVAFFHLSLCNFAFLQHFQSVASQCEHF